MLILTAQEHIYRNGLVLNVILQFAFLVNLLFMYSLVCVVYSTLPFGLLYSLCPKYLTSMCGTVAWLFLCRNCQNWTQKEVPWLCGSCFVIPLRTFRWKSECSFCSLNLYAYLFIFSNIKLFQNKKNIELWIISLRCEITFQKIPCSERWF